MPVSFADHAPDAAAAAGTGTPTADPTGGGTTANTTAATADRRHGKEFLDSRGLPEAAMPPWSSILSNAAGDGGPMCDWTKMLGGPCDFF